jgi:hypothetical protein
VVKKGSKKGIQELGAFENRYKIGEHQRNGLLSVTHPETLLTVI